MVDMAVSNAFGSNIFDVLLGLGWPWMMVTCIVDPGAVLYVGSMSFINNSFKILVASYAAPGNISEPKKEGPAH